MGYEDRIATCVICGAEFTFTGPEQAFYALRGMSKSPDRCPTCRAALRAEFTVGVWQGGRVQPNPTRRVFPAVCGECGAETEVPFLPRQDRPVYCSTCFDRVRGRGQAGPATEPAPLAAAAMPADEPPRELEG